jgi:uncharacterized protein YaaQ
MLGWAKRLFVLFTLRASTWWLTKKCCPRNTVLQKTKTTTKQIANAHHQNLLSYPTYNRLQREGNATMLNMSEHEHVTKQQILLVDLENCPQQIHQLMHNLKQFSQVLLCYAHTTTKVPLDWIEPLTQVVNENKLKIVKMPVSGKNAADFGICFWAGVFMQQLPVDTHFIIVSEDSDLDHAVSLLKSQGRTAERVNTKQEANIDVVLVLSIQEITQKFCQHLLAHNKNRPTTKKTILNSLKSFCKNDVDKANQILTELCQQKAISLDKTDKASYNETSLKILARSP